MSREPLPEDRFRFDRSAYERPNQTWRCGRAAAWGKPCPFGPKGDGSCGGTAACHPFRDPATQRWECRRPASSGGPCAEGPRPDGGCAHCQIPCSPRRTLRSMRGRFALLALLFTLAAIGATLTYGVGAGISTNSLSAGPLSAVHARFIGDDCGACHEPHRGDLGTWLTAVVTDTDMSGACLDCHSFEGEQRTAHNFAPEMLRPMASHLSTQTECISCHVEHVGLEGHQSVLSDAQCSTCHEAQMSDFADHVAFDPQFPARRRTALQFDHASHFGKHFPQAGAAAPQDCLACHVVERAAASVPTRGFEESCGGCHAGDIDDRPLAVFSLPELSAEQFAALDHEYLDELCAERGSPEFYRSLIAARAAVEAGDPVGDFEAVAYGEGFDPVTQWALASEESDIYELAADEPVVDDLLWLYLDMAENGVAPLADLVEERAGGVATGARLLAGLGDGTVRDAICAWTANAELPDDPPHGGGWYVDGLAISYLPASHADPVMRAWLDVAVAAPSIAEETGDDAALAAIMRDTLIDPAQGPGACTSCHGVSEEAEGAVAAVDWVREDVPWSPYVTYSHGPHINLMGEGRACSACHVIDDGSDVAAAFEGLDPFVPASSFRPIGKDRCVDCHGGDERQAVAQDRGCLLCHRYHLDSGFRRQMTDAQPETEPTSP